MTPYPSHALPVVRWVVGVPTGFLLLLCVMLAFVLHVACFLVPYLSSLTWSLTRLIDRTGERVVHWIGA